MSEPSSTTFTPSSGRLPLGSIGFLPSRPTKTSALRCLRVIVEAAAGLASEIARLDHLDQERRRPVLRVLESFEEHVHHRELDVETDEIGERERADGMPAA